VVTVGGVESSVALFLRRSLRWLGVNVSAVTGAPQLEV
jgi:hypothetical protein